MKGLSFFRTLKENFGLTVFSLVLTTIIFYRTYRYELVRVTTVEVKLIYKYPKNLLLISGEVEALKVTLQGPDTILKEATSKIWRYTLDLSDAQPGAMQVELYTQQLRKIFPIELRVIRVHPSLLDLVFAKRERKVLPIEVPLKGRPAFGYRLTGMKIFPQKIEVEGPDILIRKLKKIVAPPLNLNNKKRDQTISIKLNKPNRLINFTTPPLVKVTLNFLELKDRKEYKNIPVKVVNFLNKGVTFRVEPEKITVIVRGPLAQLHYLKDRDLRAEVDASDLSEKKEGTFSLPVRVRPPTPQLEIVTVPKEVNLHLVPLTGDKDEAEEKAERTENKKPAPKKIKVKKSKKKKVYKKRLRKNSYRKSRRKVRDKKKRDRKKGANGKRTHLQKSRKKSLAKKVDSKITKEKQPDKEGRPSPSVSDSSKSKAPLKPKVKLKPNGGENKGALPLKRVPIVGGAKAGVLLINEEVVKDKKRDRDKKIPPKKRGSSDGK